MNHTSEVKIISKKNKQLNHCVYKVRQLENKLEQLK